MVLALIFVKNLKKLSNFRDSLEDGDHELRETHKGNESLKQCYELNKEIQQIIERKQGKIMLEKEIYHERYFFFINLFLFPFYLF